MGDKSLNLLQDKSLSMLTRIKSIDDFTKPNLKRSGGKPLEVNSSFFEKEDISPAISINEK